MKLDNTLFDETQKQAESSPRLRMHYYLRTQAGWDYKGWDLSVIGVKYMEGLAGFLGVVSCGTV